VRRILRRIRAAHVVHNVLRSHDVGDDAGFDRQAGALASLYALDGAGRTNNRRARGCRVGAHRRPSGIERLAHALRGIPDFVQRARGLQAGAAIARITERC
jgi:hypothetical protein